MVACLQGSVLVGPGAESTEPLPYPSCPPGHHPVTHSQAAGANHSTTGPDKGILYHLSSLREVVGSGGRHVVPFWSGTYFIT